VRDGAVDILQEDGSTTGAFESGGFTLDPPARRERPDTQPFDYNALLDADRESLREYNAAIDARIEREARLSPSPFESVKESEMPFLLSVVSMVARSANPGRQAAREAGSGFNEIANKASTPLGDAAPFEYVKSAAGDDVLSIAARGVGEAHEAECHTMYEFELDQCEFTRAIYNDPRSYALCKQHAFTNYQTCRGY